MFYLKNDVFFFSSRGGIGSGYTNHYVTLVARRQQTSSAMPDFFEDIKIYHYNPATGRNTTYYPDELGKLNHDSILRGSISVCIYTCMMSRT